MNTRSAEDLQNLPIKNPYIREARELLELISQKPEDRHKYAARVDEVRDYYSGLSAERGFGRQEGHQKAMYEVARDLLKQGVSMEVITAITKLSVDEIKKLLH